MNQPILTVDVIIEYPEGKIVLVKRKNEPFQGMWAIPGGRVEVGETVEHAAVREAKEETGLDIKLERILGVYSAPGRDPRGHTVNIVYVASKLGGVLQAADDAADTTVTSDFMGLPLAFDHEKILRDYKGL